MSSVDDHRHAIIKFVEDGPSYIEVLHPETGYTEGPRGVVLMEGRGPYLVFDSHTPNMSANVVKFSSAVFSDEDTIKIILARQHPKTILVLRRARTSDEREEWDVRADAIFEYEDDWRNVMREQLQRAETLTAEPLANRKFRFARWMEWVSREGLYPAGVVMLNAERTHFTFFPFPGFEDLASTYTQHYTIKGSASSEDEAFEILRDRTYRTTGVSMLESIKAASFGDAAMRAMDRVARDVLRETGTPVYA